MPLPDRNTRTEYGRFITATVLFLYFGIAPYALAGEDWDVTSPPGDSRQISIDVSEGTWMNLDMSPDGRAIVFDLLGDIYWLPVEGGEAKAITSGVSWDMQPRFSPDGQRIAFTSDRGGANNIWTVYKDGSAPRQVSSETFRLVNNPSWSTDGQFIVARKHFTTYRSLGTGEIWLYNLQGGDGIPVVERPDENHQKELGEPVISRDGKFLYYSQDTTPGPIFQYAQDSNGGIFEIFQYNMRSRTTRSVVSGAGGAVRPTPSPDGRYLAFVRRNHARSALFLKDLTNGQERLLVDNLDQDLQEVWAIHGVYPNMAWTPDSKSVLYWAGGHIRTVHIDSLMTNEIPFHVRDSRSITPAVHPRAEVAPDIVTIRMIRNAQVSPDGKRVVFEATGRLYAKTLPNGEVRPLTSDPETHFEFQPSWSRNSRHIVFVAWDDRELGQIRVVAANGGRSRRVSEDPGHYRSPQFSPDGKRIVYQKSTGGFLLSPEWSMDPGIYVMPSKGGQATLVTDSGEAAHFGLHNERIFYMRREGTGRSLISSTLSGNDQVVHATSESVSQYSVSPDERHLAFRDSFHIYSMPMPPAGKPVQVSSKSNSVPTVRVSGDGGDFAHWSAGGESLNWTLGPLLFQTRIRSVDNALSSDADDDDEQRQAPASLSLSFQLQADKPVGKIALTGARIIAMADTVGAAIDNGVIIVDGNRIVAVGKIGSIKIPPDAVVLDLKGKTIIPGIIDAHAHTPQGSGVTPQQNWANYATLAFGVTTIHDPGNVSTEIFPAAEMQRLGRILGPRIFSAGNVLYGARSYGLYAAIDSMSDAISHVRRLKAQGAHSVKNYNQPRREQRQQIVAAAREEGLLVIAEGASLISLDLSLVADGNAGIEHNLPQSSLYDDVTQFWSQTNVDYTPTLVVSFGGLSAEQYWYQQTDVWKHPILAQFVPPHILRPRAIRRQMAPLSDYHHLRSAETAKLMADSGITVSVGGHGQREGLASHWEMWSLVQGGMSAAEALRAATINAARHLGLDADLGTIEPGKLADLVVLDGDPLADIRNSDRVKLVIQNGRVFDAATLNERITGNRKTHPFYWQDQSGFDPH